PTPRQLARPHTFRIHPSVSCSARGHAARGRCAADEVAGCAGGYRTMHTLLPSTFLRRLALLSLVALLVVAGNATREVEAAPTAIFPTGTTMADASFFASEFGNANKDDASLAGGWTDSDGSGLDALVTSSGPVSP